MTTAEKAKAYDEALELARDYYKANLKLNNADENLLLEDIFPELKESEDEKTRKALIEMVHDTTGDELWVDYNVHKEEALAWLEKQGKSSDQIHYWTEEEIEPIISDYLRGVEHYGGMIGRLRCLKPKSLEKQGGNPAPININKMVMEYSQTKDGDFGLPVNCQIRAYRQGLTDAISTLNLEKQGEKQPILAFNANDWYVSKVDGKIHNIYHSVDKVEPKFKVGDWVIDKQGIVHQIANVIENLTNHTYGYDIVGGGYFNDNTEGVRLWTIQDAKDGDVLACGDKVTDCPFIFHNLTEELNPRSYCGVAKCQHFQYNDENCGFWCHSDEVRPATKEQRELLFKKMEEAGYEWDSEKKELKKIEDEIEIPFGAKDSELQEETYYIPKGFHAEIEADKVVIKKGEKPAAWSDEDDAYKEFVISAVEDFYDEKNPLQKNLIDWLKSLKDRIGG